jgi:hypothetical protein
LIVFPVQNSLLKIERDKCFERRNRSGMTGHNRPAIAAIFELDRDAYSLLSNSAQIDRLSKI